MLNHWLIQRATKVGPFRYAIWVDGFLSNVPVLLNDGVGCVNVWSDDTRFIAWAGALKVGPIMNVNKFGSYPATGFIGISAMQGSVRHIVEQFGLPQVTVTSVDVGPFDALVGIWPGRALNSRFFKMT